MAATIFNLINSRKNNKRKTFVIPPCLRLQLEEAVEHLAILSFENDTVQQAYLARQELKKENEKLKEKIQHIILYYQKEVANQRYLYNIEKEWRIELEKKLDNQQYIINKCT